VKDARTATAVAAACFLGEFEYTVDAQRRLAIPSAWRAPASEANHFVLLPGRDRSLQLVPAAMFEELLVKLRKVSFADAQAAVALATVGSMAADCRADRQGRIMLTPKLLAHAGIRDRALLLGAVTTVQIWAPETWAQRRMDHDQGLDVIQALQERPDELSDILRKAVQPPR